VLVTGVSDLLLTAGKALSRVCGLSILNEDWPQSWSLDPQNILMRCWLWASFGPEDVGIRRPDRYSAQAA